MTTIHATSAIRVKKLRKDGVSSSSKSDAPSVRLDLTGFQSRQTPTTEPVPKRRSSTKKYGLRLSVPPAGLKFYDLVEIERNGVPAEAFAGSIEKLKLPSSMTLEFFNIPKSTYAHKIKTGGRFEGTDALASIRLRKLLLLAESIVANSLHPDAKNFDSGKWLGEWIKRPQPALGGLKPADLLDTEAGGLRVQQVLASIESGAYQ